jgi:hypothetical protein
MTALEEDETLKQFIWTMVSPEPEARPGSMQAVATALGALENRDGGTSPAPDDSDVPQESSGGFLRLLRKVFPFRLR